MKRIIKKGKEDMKISLCVSRFITLMRVSRIVLPFNKGDPFKLRERVERKQFYHICDVGVIESTMETVFHKWEIK